MRLVEAAPAKVNLFLHVGPAQADGYHPLASLMTFADFGDELALEDGEGSSLNIDGPFAEGLSAVDNLVIRARDALLEASGLRPPPFRLTLHKSLPMASGVGGGSADAAATLRLLRRRFEINLPASAWHALALKLGADVPACLESRACLAEGRGERLRVPPAFPALDAVLVNPWVAVSTGEVFRRFDAQVAGQTPTIPAHTSAAMTLSDTVAWLTMGRNDLQAPAISFAPVIADVLARLQGLDQTLLARMSGSGATCFALFPDAAAASAAASRLRAEVPGWWVTPCRLAGTGGLPHPSRLAATPLADPPSP